MLDFVDKTFDQSPFPIAIRIIVARCFAIFARRDHWNRVMVENKGNQIITIISAIRQDIITQLVAQQRLTLGAIMSFAARQSEAQRIAQGIRFYVDFGAESTTVASQGLGVLSAVFFGAPAAHGWARTTVLSSITFSISGSSTK